MWGNESSYSMFRKKEEEKKDEVHSKEAEKMPVDGENIEGREPQSEIYEEAEVRVRFYNDTMSYSQVMEFDLVPLGEY